MKKQLLAIIMVAGVSTVSNAEIQISITGDDTVSLSVDGKNKTSHINIDRANHAADTTMSTNITIDGEPAGKEQKKEYCKNKVERYKNKIAYYEDKINKYEDKILDKPKNKEKYERKIEESKSKISIYKDKIIEAEKKCK